MFVVIYYAALIARAGSAVNRASLVHRIGTSCDTRHGELIRQQIVIHSFALYYVLVTSALEKCT